MKRTFLLIFLCLFLVSCASVPANATYDETVASFENDKNYYPLNVRSNYYSYHLPADMHIKESNGSSSVLVYDRNPILINLNLIDILNVDSDDFNNESGFYSNDKLIYSKSGTFLLRDNSHERYEVEIYQLENDAFVMLYTSALRLYGYSRLENSNDILDHLFLIAKNAIVDKALVLNDFDNTITIDYEKKQVNLFEIVIPKTGYLGDMLVDGKGNPSDENNTNNESNSEPEEDSSNTETENRETDINQETENIDEENNQ